MVVRQNEKQRNIVSTDMTFKQIKENLENKRTLWNLFGFWRRVCAPNQQPTMKKVVLRTNPDGSQIILERDSSIIGKNGGTLHHIGPDKKIKETKRVYGPWAKSDISLMVGATLLTGITTALAIRAGVVPIFIFL